MICGRITGTVWSVGIMYSTIFPLVGGSVPLLSANLKIMVKVESFPLFREEKRGVGGCGGRGGEMDEK